MVFPGAPELHGPLMKVGPRWRRPCGSTPRCRLEAERHAGAGGHGGGGAAGPGGIYDKYPHELSGGMLQRAMIAAAIVNRPKLLLLDEPTTALDVTIQAQILEMLKKLNRESGMSMLFISHNLKVVRKLCPRVAVMQRGVLVEEETPIQVFYHPQHPLHPRSSSPPFPPGTERRSGHDGRIGTLPSTCYRRVPGRRRAGPKYFHEVLHDVSFDVHRGEILDW